jgi:hypothetical protein
MHQKSNNKNAIPLHFNKKAPHARGSFYGQGVILSVGDVGFVRIVTLFCNAGGSKKKTAVGGKAERRFAPVGAFRTTVFLLCAGIFAFFG